MKMASYEDAWLRENDQTHRPGLSSTFIFTVRIDLQLQHQVQVRHLFGERCQVWAPSSLTSGAE